ncbi:hypothetical protein, partial [Bacillus pseudomycoides]|uniref:hypothetical protein n=1 Tax=Bacillus pseudomycoides TaxID=64104 RepID=UPI00195502DE
HFLKVACLTTHKTCYIYNVQMKNNKKIILVSISVYVAKKEKYTIPIRCTASILEKNHAKSMQDFMQKIGRHREL